MSFDALYEHLKRERDDRRRRDEIRAATDMMLLYGYDLDPSSEVFHVADCSRVSVSLAVAVERPAFALLAASGVFQRPRRASGPN